MRQAYLSFSNVLAQAIMIARERCATELRTGKVTKVRVPGGKGSCVSRCATVRERNLSYSCPGSRAAVPQSCRPRVLQTTLAALRGCEETRAHETGCQVIVSVYASSPRKVVLSEPAQRNHRWFRMCMCSAISVVRRDLTSAQGGRRWLGRSVALPFHDAPARSLHS